jgi:hypothetical protein
MSASQILRASKAFQAKALERLANVFGAEHVHKEFSIDTDATDAFGPNAEYLPRLDLALGPFNVTSDRYKSTQIIRAAANNRFIEELIKIAAKQNGAFIQNKNPRCLLAIEIEFSGSSKLIMGDFTNAGMMGHVGLVIGPNDGKKMEQIASVQKYIHTLRKLEKADATLFMNVACLKENEFWEILECFCYRQ